MNDCCLFIFLLILHFCACGIILQTQFYERWLAFSSSLSYILLRIRYYFGLSVLDNWIIGFFLSRYFNTSPSNTEVARQYHAQKCWNNGRRKNCKKKLRKNTQENIINRRRSQQFFMKYWGRKTIPCAELLASSSVNSILLRMWFYCLATSTFYELWLAVSYFFLVIHICVRGIVM